MTKPRFVPAGLFAPNSSRRNNTLFLVGLLFVAFALNLHLLNRFPLREDEALYSYWARYLFEHDPWLLHVWPDKPPLYLWSQAAVFALLGASQATARIFNIAITTATVALVAATSRRLWHNDGRGAAILYALNPFTISFAATAYTDPTLVFWGQLALYLTLCQRELSAGIALGAAIVTKQQGILYVPLIVACAFEPQALLPQPMQGPIFTTRTIQRRLCVLAIGVALVIIPVFLWDSQRWSVAPSPWDLSVRNYGGIALVSAAAWLPRSADWAALLRFMGGNWYNWPLYTLLALFAAIRIRQDATPSKRFVVLLLLSWLFVFMLLHIATSIQIWDRYLLPLVPLFALLLAPGTDACIHSRALRVSTHFALLFLLLPGALRAAQGGFPLGGDHGAYTGLNEAVSWIKEQRTRPPTALPLIIFQQSLGWQLQFYLYDEIQNGDIEVRWFANAITLADNAAKSTANRRYLLAPTWQSPNDITLHMATRNLGAVEQISFGVMTLYVLENKTRPPCDWCLCRTDVSKHQLRHVPWPLLPLANAGKQQGVCREKND